MHLNKIINHRGVQQAYFVLTNITDLVYSLYIVSDYIKIAVTLVTVLNLA